MTAFVKAQDELRGKRAACVASVIEQLIEAEGEPVAWSDLMDNAGMDHHGQLMPAMHALEMVGAVERYEYTDDGGTRSKPAFALAEDVEVDHASA